MKQQYIDEVVCFYKEAKDKKFAIQVLSDMYLCSKEDIIELLNINGFSIDPNLFKPKKMNYFSPEEDNFLIQYIDQEIKFKKLYEAFIENGFNRPYGSVLNRMKILKKAKGFCNV